VKFKRGGYWFVEKRKQGETKEDEGRGREGRSCFKSPHSQLRFKNWGGGTVIHKGKRGGKAVTHVGGSEHKAGKKSDKKKRRVGSIGKN